MGLVLQGRGGIHGVWFCRTGDNVAFGHSWGLIFKMVRGRCQLQPSHVALMTYLLQLGNKAHGPVNLGVIIHCPFHDALTASVGDYLIQFRGRLPNLEQVLKLKVSQAYQNVDIADLHLCGVGLFCFRKVAAVDAVYLGILVAVTGAGVGATMQTAAFPACYRVAAAGGA